MPATITAPVSAATIGRNTSAGTTLAIPYVSGVSVGDCLELQANISSATAPTTPSGWTLQVDLNSGGSSPSIRVWTRIATSTDVTHSTNGDSVSVTTPNATSQGRMRRMTGVDQTTPVDAVIDSTHATYSSSTAATAFTIQATTTALANTMASVVGAGNSASGSWTPPTSQGGGWTETWDDITTTPKSTHDYLLWTGSGATGTVNLVASANVRGCAAVIFYRPAATQFAASGQVDATSAVSGSAAYALPASGQADGVSAASGSVDHLLRPVDAQVDIVSDAVGSATYIVGASGTVAATSGASGSAGLITAASGTVDVVSGAYGSVAPQYAASGQVDGVSGATGSANLLAATAGTVAATSGTSGGVALLARTSGTVAAVSAVSGSAAARLVVGALAFNSYVEITGSAILTTAAVGLPVDVISGVYGSAGIASDISVIAVLDARTWSAELDARTWEASLD